MEQFRVGWHRKNEVAPGCTFCSLCTGLQESTVALGPLDKITTGLHISLATCCSPIYAIYIIRQMCVGQAHVEISLQLLMRCMNNTVRIANSQNPSPETVERGISPKCPCSWCPDGTHASGAQGP